MQCWPSSRPSFSLRRSGCAAKGASPRRAVAGASCPAQICAEVRAAVIGLGSVGARAARQLVSSADIDSVFIFDNDPTRLAEVGTALGERAIPLAGPEADGQGVSVAVLATPVGDHLDLARHASRSGPPRRLGERRRRRRDRAARARWRSPPARSADRRRRRLRARAVLPARSSWRRHVRLGERAPRREVRHRWAGLCASASRSPRRQRDGLARRHVGRTARWVGS